MCIRWTLSAWCCSGQASPFCRMCWRCLASTSSAGEKWRACWRSRARCWWPTGCMRGSSSFRSSTCGCLTFARFVSRRMEASLRGWELAACRSCRAYQTGLGYTPVQSGLLIVPQAIAAMGMKAILRKLLGGIGYKGVLVSNTLAIGMLLMIFTTIHLHTSVSQIVAIVFFYGACTSLQYTTMNTLVYADVEEKDASSASSIASTMQQMSISFGVAFAGLTTAFFVPGAAYSDPVLMIHGIHKALLCLGALTMVSTVVLQA